MCFGNQVQTEKKTTDTTLPGYLSDAAKANVANAAALTSQPFQAYTDPRVAARTDAQNTASGLIKTAAGTSNPYTSRIEGAYGGLIDTPASTITAPSIIGPNTDVNTSTIQDYMNPYLEAALAPQLQAIARQGDADRKRLNAGATFSGAFGDARHGVESSNQSRDENILTSNTIGQGYNTAFNTAAGLRGSDISNALNVQNANAANKEAALARAATGASGLMGLDKYNTGRAVDLANALEAQGGKEQANNQAALDANFQEFMRRQGYGPDMIKLFTSVLAGTPHDTSQVATTEAPDNSGYGILSALFGTAAKAALAPATGGASLLTPMNISPGQAGGTNGALGGLY
jgi:hypothetical protein